MLFPTYHSCAKTYHQYLWSVYARVYQNVGESIPLELANQALPLNHIHRDDMVLLKAAERLGILEKQLTKQEQELLITLETKINTGEIIINALVIVVMVIALSAPIIAMYLPILKLGAAFS